MKNLTQITTIIKKMLLIIGSDVKNNIQNFRKLLKNRRNNIIILLTRNVECKPLYGINDKTHII